MLNINEYLINKNTKEKSNSNKIEEGMRVLLLELTNGDVKNAMLRSPKIASVTGNEFEVYIGHHLTEFVLYKKHAFGLTFPGKDWYIATKKFRADDVYIIHPVKAVELLEKYMDDPTDYFVENVELDSIIDLQYLQKIYDELKKYI